MRFWLSIISVVLSASLWGASATPQQPSPAQEAVIKAFKRVKTLKAKFRQVDSSGKTKIGTLYLSRPGKLKMEVEKPLREILIVKGKWIAHHIPENDEVTHIPLENTPADMILKGDEGLENTLLASFFLPTEGHLSFVKTFETEGHQVTVSLFFDSKTLLLAGWEVEDAQGYRTQVTLSKIQENVTFYEDTFRILTP